MKTLSISEAREALSTLGHTRETITLTRRGKAVARIVVQPLDTTEHLMSTPANVRRLDAARDEIEAEIARRKKSA